MYSLINMAAVVPSGSLQLFSYILLQVFLGVLLLIWLLHFLYSSDPHCYQGCLIYVVLLLKLYKNLRLNLFFLSSRDDELSSTRYDSTFHVLKVPVYILIFFLCMLLSFFSLPVEAVLYNWPPLSIFNLYIALYSFF